MKTIYVARLDLTDGGALYYEMNDEDEITVRPEDISNGVVSVEVIAVAGAKS